MGAIRTIELLQSLKDLNNLSEAKSFNMHSLTFAAMALLHVELSGQDVPGIEIVGTASALAEELLKDMALRHPAALGCYESLYVRVPFFVSAVRWFTRGLLTCIISLCTS